MSLNWQAATVPTGLQFNLSVANCNSAGIDLVLTDLRSGRRGVIFSAMREWLILVAHLVVTIIKIAAPGGARSVVAESLILKHQLLILNRSRKRAPRLGPVDRVLLGLGTLLVSPRRLIKVAVANQARHAAAISSRAGPAQISTAVLG